MRRHSRDLATAFALAAAFVLCGGCGDGGAHVRTVVSADGVPIYSSRRGHGPVVVLVHGWCCDHTIWDPVVADLSHDYQVVTIDLAGHGQSGLLRDRFTVPAFGEDVAAVLRSFDLHDAVLVGHSLGGDVVVAAALAVPDRVRALVGIDTLHRVEPIIAADKLASLVASMRGDFAGFMRSFVGSMFPAGTDSTLVQRVVTDMSREPVDVAVSAFTGMVDYDLAAAARKLRVPLRLINADTYPVDEQSWREDGVDVQVTTLKGSGHFPMLTQPDAFIAALRRTLADLPERSPS